MIRFKNELNQDLQIIEVDEPVKWDLELYNSVWRAIEEKNTTLYISSSYDLKDCLSHSIGYIILDLTPTDEKKIIETYLKIETHELKEILKDYEYCIDYEDSAIDFMSKVISCKMEMDIDEILDDIYYSLELVEDEY